MICIIKREEYGKKDDILVSGSHERGRDGTEICEGSI